MKTLRILAAAGLLLAAASACASDTPTGPLAAPDAPARNVAPAAHRAATTANATSTEPPEGGTSRGGMGYGSGN